SNIGLFEERLSMISRNRAMATKEKMEALEKMVDVIAKYGEVETMLKMHDIETLDYRAEQTEDSEKIDARQTALANEFMQKIMGSINQPQEQQMQQQSM
ncbi:hypothetical protein LRR18_16470, partial [Mangrovimonas sp. AS39]|uniref:hypothetical protein n=1 Tax=Mangrovimonas futianensis TaxID=2895523 RepID=UPI001E657FDB